MLLLCLTSLQRSYLPVETKPARSGHSGYPRLPHPHKTGMCVRSGHACMPHLQAVASLAATDTHLGAHVHPHAHTHLRAVALAIATQLYYTVLPNTYVMAHACLAGPAAQLSAMLQVLLKLTQNNHDEPHYPTKYSCYRTCLPG